MEANLNNVLQRDAFLQKYPNIFGNRNAFNWAWQNRERNGISENGVMFKRLNRVWVDVAACEKWLAATPKDAA